MSTWLRIRLVFFKNGELPRRPASRAVLQPVRICIRPSSETKGA